MTTGEATIWLELDKTRGTISDWNGNRPTYHVERTGWKRFLTLTRSLHNAKAEYGVDFELDSPSRYFTVKDTLPLCEGARLKATVVWWTR